MPGFDGTGPRGMGPMTGWGRGFCVVPLSPSSPMYTEKGDYPPSYRIAGSTPYYGAGSTNPAAIAFASQMTREQELAFLKNQAQAMKKQLEKIEVKIQQIETCTEAK